MGSFVSDLNMGMNNEFNPQDNVFESIWKEYKSVILYSLVTSFGLDFLVHDQSGGDVDTVNNVRQIGVDPEMRYKNPQNATDYNNRGAYDPRSYHQDPRYIAINKKLSEKKKAGKLTDAYTGQQMARNANADLDHVIAAKKIHNDRGRILAGLVGEDLANTEDNLKPTDRSINRSMQDKDIEAYLAKLGENATERKNRISFLKSKKALTDKEGKELAKLEKLDKINPDKMRAENETAKNAYDAKIRKAYYTDGKFYKDTAVAAGKRGAEMGMRQAFGLVFVEIYMGAEQELKNMPANSGLKDMLKAVASGVKKGSENAKKRYKEIFSKFGEGFVSGSLASITTTICNIFFTTAKNLVKCIRQIFASVVQAGKVLLFNPDNLRLGDRIKTAAVIIATGASVLVGTVVGEIIGKTPVGMLPVIGQIVQTFAATLVSGLLACTLLVFLDRSKFINSLIDRLNTIPSEANNYKEMADVFERLAAKLENIDIAKFRADTQKYQDISEKIAVAKDEKEINALLLMSYKDLNIQIPWEGDFDAFMGNKNNQLVFG